MRYDWTVNDTGVARFPGSVFKLSAHGLMCADVRATQLIEIEWSHRYLEGAEPKIAESSAEPFLASVKMSEAVSAEASPPVSPHTPGTVLFRDSFKDQSGRWRYGIKRNVNGKLKNLAWSAGTIRGDLVAPAFVHIVAQCYGDGPVTLVLSANGITLLRFEDTGGAITSGGRASFYANGDAGPATTLNSFIVRELSR